MHKILTEKFIKMYDSLVTILKNHKEMAMTIVDIFLSIIDISLYLIEKLLIMFMIVEIINNLPFSKELYEIQLDEIKALSSYFVIYGFIAIWMLKFIGIKIHAKQFLKLIPYLPIAYLLIKLLIRIEKTELILPLLIIRISRIFFEHIKKKQITMQS